MYSGRLTKGGLKGICEDLSRIWKVDVRPEGITEGGLLVGNRGYKSVRFHSPTGDWPSIPDGLDKMGDDDIIFPDLKGGKTFFKAFEGAPRWTVKEMMDVKRIITNYT